MGLFLYWFIVLCCVWWWYWCWMLWNLVCCLWMLRYEVLFCLLCVGCLVVVGVVSEWWMWKVVLMWVLRLFVYGCLCVELIVWVCWLWLLVVYFFLLLMLVLICGVWRVCIGNVFLVVVFGGWLYFVFGIGGLLFCWCYLVVLWWWMIELLLMVGVVVLGWLVGMYVLYIWVVNFLIVWLLGCCYCVFIGCFVFVSEWGC